MKKFLRKANRGLILGGALVIGVTVYVIADLNRFKDEKPVIEQTIAEYADAVEKFNITPEQYRQYNIKYNKEDSQKQISEFYQFADEYWIDSSEANVDIFSYYIDKDAFKNSMRDLVENKTRGYITEFSVDMTDYKINKNGPDGAAVECTANIYFVGAENSAVITPSGYDMYYSYYDPESPVEPKVMQTSFSQQCTFFLEKESEGWKITKCESFDNYDTRVTAVKDSESDSEE